MGETARTKLNKAGKVGFIMKLKSANQDGITQVVRDEKSNARMDSKSVKETPNLMQALVKGLSQQTKQQVMWHTSVEPFF